MRADAEKCPSFKALRSTQFSKNRGSAFNTRRSQVFCVPHSVEDAKLAEATTTAHFE